MTTTPMTTIRGPLLAFDTASPQVSIAAGFPTGPLAVRTLALQRSSERLLDEVDAVLDEIGCALGELAGVVALRGPGSFTGLRVGLGTALGLHQATGLPATALSNLAVLAAASGTPGEEVIAAVDALRGDWYTRRFRVAPLPNPLSAAALVPGAQLAAKDSGRLVGFGISRLAAEQSTNSGLALVEPPPLATFALRLAAEPDTVWDPTHLTAPIYFRPPAVTQPRKHRPAGR